MGNFKQLILLYAWMSRRFALSEGALVPSSNQKTAYHFLENRKSAINITQNQETAKQFHI